MKKILDKKIIIGMMIGLVLSVGGVYAANTCLATDIKYKETTVNAALDDLYLKANGTIPVRTLEITDYYQFNFGDKFTYKNKNANILSVDNSGLVNINKSGNDVIEVVNENDTVIKYNVKAHKVFTVNSYFASTNSANRGNGEITDSTKAMNLRNILIDGIKTKQGSYGALMMGKDAFVKFTISENVKISFSSNSYKDSAGSSGKDALFYKVDSEGNEELYYTLTQLNSTQDYGEHLFEPGNYVLRSGGAYLEFDEWTFKLQ